MINYKLSDKDTSYLKQMYQELITMRNNILRLKQNNEREMRKVANLSEEEYNAHYDECLTLEMNGYRMNGLEDYLQEAYRTIEEFETTIDNTIL